MKDANWKLLGAAALAIVCALAAGCGQTNAANFEYEENPKKANMELIVTGYIGAGKTVSIPAKIGGKKVSAVGAEAFRGKGLTSAAIPSGVTVISTGAFAENQLTGVALPKGVVVIGTGAFSGNQLASVTIGNGVADIGREAFAKNRLTGVTIPHNVTEIHQDAFASNQLTSIAIGANVSFTGNWGSVSFDNRFDNFYYSNGRKAGTYTYSDERWAYQQ